MYIVCHNYNMDDLLGSPCNVMKIASKTLELFEQAVVKDGGNKFRFYLRRVLPHMADAYSQEEDDFRSHLGASLIGGECDRALWYGFRWFKKPSFSGRILRLFNRGHMEEARFIALLLASGIKVFQQDGEGKQFRISSLGGHFGGSGDGVAVGIPDIPEDAACLLEFKTHSDSSFKKLQKEGVQRAKPEHYVQMQMYMDDMKLDYGLYLAVNKNDNSIHAEIIGRERHTAPVYKGRAARIIFATKAPERINENPSWFTCKYCDFSKICHEGASPEANCRTCLYATALEDGKWHCRMHSKVLDKKQQAEGCNQYARFE